MKYLLLIILASILLSCHKNDLSNDVGLPIQQVIAEKIDTTANRIYVEITKDGQYFINQNELPLDFIEDELAYLIQGKKGETVVITIDPDAPNQYLVKIATITSKLKAKTVISVKPE